MDFFQRNILGMTAPSSAVNDDIERQGRDGQAAQQQSAMREQQNNARSRFSLGRPQRLSALWRRSTVEPVPVQAAQHPEIDVDSPKTPIFTLNMPNISSTAFDLPHLASNESTSPGAPTPGPRSPSLGPQSPMTNFDGTHAVYSPVTNSGFYRAPTTYSPATTHDFRDPPTGYTPAGYSVASFPGPEHPVLEDPVLAAPTPAVTADRRRPVQPGQRRRAQRNQLREGEPEQDEGRRHRHERQRSRKRKRHHQRRQQQQQTPKRFLFCFPWVKSQRMRSRILTCFVSGLFLLLMLTVYLSLALTKQINTQDFSVVLILIILVTTIVFCHSLIRICMMVMRPKSDSSSGGSRNLMNHFLAPGGYAIPERPIRVVLARDEEAAGLDSTTTHMKPPAYGLWRESVRVDPNRIYWQRNEEAPNVQEGEDPSSSASGPSGNARITVPRPPSYSSDDGVSYVVEAHPRSIAPTTDVPLPAHPSERVAGAWRGHPAAR